MAEMELDCWKGDWGLPSVDRDCLKVLAYAQFAGSPIKVNRNKSLWRNPTAHYPVFRSNDTVLYSSESIIDHLKRNNFNADAELSDQQRADILAFTSLLEERLLPALQYMWWVDAKNYAEFSRPWFARAVHFPFNYIIPGQIQRSAEAKLEASRGGLHLEDGELSQKVIKDAKYCINLLSERLGEREFYFGQSPTSLDALVFSYLAPLIKAPFPSNALQLHCKACDNLGMFCSRILQRYFPQDPESISSEAAPKAPKKETDGDSFDDPHKRRNQILSVLFATAAMVSYALFSGMVQFEVVDDEDFDDEGILDEDGGDYQSHE